MLIRTLNSAAPTKWVRHARAASAIGGGKVMPANFTLDHPTQVGSAAPFHGIVENSINYVAQHLSEGVLSRLRLLNQQRAAGAERVCQDATGSAGGDWLEDGASVRSAQLRRRWLKRPSIVGFTILK